MRFVPLLALVAVSTAISAQAQGSDAIYSVPTVNQRCPVSLFVKRLGGGNTVQTGAGTSAHSQALSLIFTPVSLSRLVHAQVTLHGHFAGDRVLPAGTKPGNEATEDFSVSPSPQEAYRSQAFLRSRGLATVNWIELKTLKFGDSTEWHAAPNSVCRFTPYPYTLVTSPAHGN